MAGTRLSIVGDYAAWVPPAPQTRRPAAGLGRDHGFSLAELMIALVVLLVTAGGIVTVLRVSQSVHHKTQQGVDLQQNVRAALNLICRELVNAGSGIPYLTRINGSPAVDVPAGTRLGPLGSPVAAGAVYFVTPCDGAGETVFTDGAGNLLPASISTDMLVFLGGTGDARFVNQAPPGPTSGWGAVVFLENNSGFGVGQVVLVSNGFQVSLGQVTQVLPNGGLQFSNGQDELDLNSPGDAQTPNPNFWSAKQIPGGPPPQAFPLASITYYVDATTNPLHPMLRRLANSAGGRSAGVAVADDIEDLQVTFLVDDDANATSPSVPIAAPSTAQLPLVRGVILSVTGRSHVKMGDSSQADGHSRLTLSQAVFFRNNIRR